MPKVIAEIKIIPLGTGTPSVSVPLSRAMKILVKSNIPYIIGPNGTTLEGELKDIMHIAGKMHNAVFGNDVKRVLTLLSIDERRDKITSAKRKLGSIKSKLKN